MGPFKTILRRIYLSIGAGVLSGAGATLFLKLISWSTETRLAHPALVLGLPLSGLVIGVIYHYWGRDASPGTNLIIDEIHTPRREIPWQMTPFVIFSSVLTHLGGGSAGREGAIVQIGASLSEQMGKAHRQTVNERKMLLVAGAGAGFGAALGAPLAGIFFGMEFIRIRGLKVFALLECVLASFTALLCTRLLHAEQTIFPHFVWTALSLKAMLIIALSIPLVGIAARTFISLSHLSERILQKIAYPPFRTFLGGLVLAALYLAFPLHDYEGLSIPLLQSAFHQPVSAWAPVLKALLTIITITSGFKGGEFVPIVVIGTVLGSAIAQLDPSATSALAHIGFCAMFAACSKTPFSCSVMACELFGWEFAPLAFAGCFLANRLSGNHSIYVAAKKVHFT